MALLSLVTLGDYCKLFFDMPLPTAISGRRDALIKSIIRVDELHEQWLNEGHGSGD